MSEIARDERERAPVGPLVAMMFGVPSFGLGLPFLTIRTVRRALR